MCGLEGVPEPLHQYTGLNKLFLYELNLLIHLFIKKFASTLLIHVCIICTDVGDLWRSLSLGSSKGG